MGCASAFQADEPGSSPGARAILCCIPLVARRPAFQADKDGSKPSCSAISLRHLRRGIRPLTPESRVRPPGPLPICYIRFMARVSKEKQAAYQRAHYQRRKAYYKAAAAANIKKAQLFVTNYKVEKGCATCGERHPACLDFHHIGDDKEAGIAKAARSGWGLERLKAEIAKCEVLCSNCHRKLHYEERNKSV